MKTERREYMNRELQLLEDMWMELHRQCNPIVNEYNYDTFKNIEKKLDNSILEDIKAEIVEEKESAYADFVQYKVDYLGVDAEYVEDELPNDDFRYGMERCIEIINKHISGK